jgi:hypothetical protein
VSELDELTRLVPPPAHPPPLTDWQIELPEDYRALIARYGAGTLAGAVLLVPGHHDPNGDLIKQIERQHWVLNTLIEQGIEQPYAPESLLPWGWDESGNVLWWLTEGSWPVVANEARGEGWHRYEGTATGFLVALLSGEFDSDFLVIEGDDFVPHPS